ncbi:ThuA domain-containing protein [Sphingomonas solaris]|nr:ThuA domain-containing protein [Sphingomonas solaris]
MLKWAVAGLLAIVIVLALLAAPIAYRLFHGLDVYETVPPTLPVTMLSPAILVFSKTNGFRDGASIDAANAMFRQLARQREWSIVLTENGAVFNPAQLARFDAVVWNSVSGDVLTAAQRSAFRTYLEQGGGFVGIHGAGGDMSYRWRWYVEDLIGAQFTSHTMFPEFQTASIRIEDPAHPTMARLPRTWVRADEWYSFDRSVRRKGYRVLATLDETSYRPRGILLDDIAMGRDHPIIWTHCIGRGRAFYSALGHAAETYSEPLHREMLANAVTWASGREPCKDGL